VAITHANLTRGQSDTDATSYTTASVTPGANRLVLLSVASEVSSGDGAEPTISGNGLTWTLVRSTREIGTSVMQVHVFRAMGGSPSSGSITISFGSQTQMHCAWSVDEFDGVRTTGGGADAVAQSVLASGSGANMSATLASFAASSHRPYATWRHASSTEHDPESGYTEITDQVIGTGARRHYVEWHASAAEETPSTTGTVSSSWRGVAVELADTAPVTGGWSHRDQAFQPALAPGGEYGR
jgi:hypothetical protein